MPHLDSDDWEKWSALGLTNALRLKYYYSLGTSQPW